MFDIDKLISDWGAFYPTISDKENWGYTIKVPCQRHVDKFCEKVPYEHRKYLVLLWSSKHRFDESTMSCIDCGISHREADSERKSVAPFDDALHCFALMKPHKTLKEQLEDQHIINIAHHVFGKVK